MIKKNKLIKVFIIIKQMSDIGDKLRRLLSNPKYKEVTDLYKEMASAQEHLNDIMNELQILLDKPEYQPLRILFEELGRQVITNGVNDK